METVTDPKGYCKFPEDLRTDITWLLIAVIALSAARQRPCSRSAASANRTRLAHAPSRPLSRPPTAPTAWAKCRRNAGFGRIGGFSPPPLRFIRRINDGSIARLDDLEKPIFALIHIYGFDSERVKLLVVLQFDMDVRNVT